MPRGGFDIPQEQLESAREHHVEQSEKRGPTSAQMSCGRVLYGDPAICTCGTCSSIPAPWHVDPDDREDMEFNNHILAANGNTVCFMAWSGDAENNEPHEKAAKLMAAAPELLEALQECLREHGGFTIKGECERRARAAIAKAS